MLNITSNAIAIQEIKIAIIVKLLFKFIELIDNKNNDTTKNVYVIQDNCDKLNFFSKLFAKSPPIDLNK